jgi:hypothetical protein
MQLEKNVSAGDFIVFKKGNATLIGGISTASLDEVTCREFVPMSKDFMRRFCLQPLVQSLYPVSSQLTVSKLVGTDTVHVLSQDTILNIVFIVPIGEIESGKVHMTGASNLFLIRYEMTEGIHILNCPISLFLPSYYSAIECQDIFGFE